jgi:hypothetical protein
MIDYPVIPKATMVRQLAHRHLDGVAGGTVTIESRDTGGPSQSNVGLPRGRGEGRELYTYNGVRMVRVRRSSGAS